ncbi:MAG: hypothetical protein KJ060_19705 [Candidatus Hydrogenedentes bacterium]|nr:hypothetical protein [Candidatus Hydrogenedentota bacterium]
MTGKEFVRFVANGNIDVVQIVLDILSDTGSGYCVIGGLAVNAYAEPVVSLDLDIVVAVEDVEKVNRLAQERGFAIERFQHSVNLSMKGSDLRIQLQMDPRYQSFIPNAETKSVLGYEMKVAGLGDVLQGKIWAYLDKERRKSKRQKDLSDILRLLEGFPDLEESLPQSLRDELNEE